MKNKKLKGYFFVLISSFGFSLVPLLAKHALDNGMNAETVLTYRFTIAALFFILYASMRGISLKVPSRHRIKLIGIGGLYALESAIFFEAFNYISPGFGQLLFQVNPMMVAIGGFFILKEAFTRQKIAALVLVVLGCCLLFWSPQSFVTLKGVGLVLFAALLYTTYVIIGKETLDTISPIVVTTYLTTTCALFLIIYSFTIHNFVAIPSYEVMASIGLLTILSTIVAILAFSVGLQLLDATNAAILCASEPLITVGLSYLIYNESLNAIQLIGSVLIVLSVIVMDLKLKNNPEDNIVNEL